VILSYDAAVDLSGIKMLGGNGADGAPGESGSSQPAKGGAPIGVSALGMASSRKVNEA
jgi:hypothetical protein